MAMYVISLQDCNNFNPYNDCIIPKDQLECLLAGSRTVGWCGSGCDEFG